MNSRLPDRGGRAGPTANGCYRPVHPARSAGTTWRGERRAHVLRRPQLARHIPPVVVQNQADRDGPGRHAEQHEGRAHARVQLPREHRPQEPGERPVHHPDCQRGTDVIQQAASQEGPSKASSAAASAGCGGKRSPRELAASRSRRGAVLRSGARGVRRPQTPDTLNPTCLLVSTRPPSQVPIT